MASYFAFKDVEDSLEKFSGESERDLETWLKAYEDVAKMCKWNDMQKYLFARKLLIGAKKEAIEADSKAINYTLLVERLKNEFEDKLTVIEIHERLIKRKKTSERKRALNISREW